VFVGEVSLLSLHLSLGCRWDSVPLAAWNILARDLFAHVLTCVVCVMYDMYDMWLDSFIQVRDAFQDFEIRFRQMSGTSHLYNIMCQYLSTPTVVCLSDVMGL